MTTARPLAVFAGCLLAVGLWQIAAGAWIYGKARLAQVLLSRAWVRAEKGVQARPWPWADTWPVARLEVPLHHIDLIVLEGAHGRTLAFGPGHLSSSAKAGDPGTAILTGHRDTHFRFLEDVESGEELWMETPGGRRHRFEVVEARVVDSRSTAISSARDESVLVLVTCYPFDAIAPGGPLRYVVTAVKRDL